MTTIQEIKALFDRKVSECQALGLSREFCMKQISNEPSLADRFIVLEEKRCLLPSLSAEESAKCKQDVLEEAIGEEAIEERQWIPISVKYPTLKGVTDEEVDDYIFEQMIHESPFLDNALMVNIGDKLEDLGVITPDMDSIEREELIRKHYLEEHFKHYKIYDRDEAFSDARVLFKKLKDLVAEREYGFKKEGYYGSTDDDYKLENSLKEHTIYVTSPRGGHELLSIFSYANDLNKKAFPSDIEEELVTEDREIKKKEKVEFGGRVIQEEEWEQQVVEYGQFNALTWLGDKRHQFVRVVFIDDVVASGDQTVKALNQFYKTFRTGLKGDVKSVSGKYPPYFEPLREGDKIKFYFLSLCKRKDPQYWMDLYDVDESSDPEAEEKAELLEKNSVTVHETIGRLGFEKNLEYAELDPDHIISCAFAWSIPDGRSDKHVKELYQEIGRTGTDQSRTVAPARWSPIKKGIKQSVPEFRYMKQIDDWDLEEKTRFANYLMSRSAFTGYHVHTPFYGEQQVYLSAAMTPTVKEDAILRIKDWLSGEMPALSYGGISKLKDDPYKVQTWSEGFLNDFGYKRNRKGLLEPTGKKKWTEPEELTEKNKKLLKVFAPIMTSMRNRSDKYIAMNIFNKVKDDPEIIEKINANPDSVWDYM